MKRHLVAALALACTALTACGPAGLTSAPAPLATTTIDESTIRATWTGFEAALDGVNVLRRLGAIKDGSASAKRLGELIDIITLALTTASAAQRAGNATDYVVAMGEARTALLGLRELLQKVN